MIFQYLAVSFIIYMLLIVIGVAVGALTGITGSSGVIVVVSRTILHGNKF